MNYRLNYIVAILLAFVVSFHAIAFADEPTVYVIKKGDTLWGISERFLKDPKYWPNLWSKNPEVTNPHLVYPGQTVRFVDGRMEIVPAEEAEGAKAAAVKPEVEQPAQVAEEKTFTVRGNEGRLIEKEMPLSGRIIAGQHSRLILGEDDTVFTDIGALQGGGDGQKYTILKKSRVISHPVTNEILGTIYYPLGILQLTRVTPNGSRAIIGSSFKEVEPGDLLVPYSEVKRREIPLKSASKPVKGMIVETYGGNSAVSTGDVVYIDLGDMHGIEVGNLFYVVRQVNIEKMMVDKVVRQVPYDVVGALIVVETGRRTSTAVVVKSIDAIFKKDTVVTAPR